MTEYELVGVFKAAVKIRKLPRSAWTAAAWFFAHPNVVDDFVSDPPLTKEDIDDLQKSAFETEDYLLLLLILYEADCDECKCKPKERAGT